MGVNNGDGEPIITETTLNAYQVPSSQKKNARKSVSIAEKFARKNVKISKRLLEKCCGGLFFYLRNCRIIPIKCFAFNEDKVTCVILRKRHLKK